MLDSGLEIELSQLDSNFNAIIKENKIHKAEISKLQFAHENILAWDRHCLHFSKFKEK